MFKIKITDATIKKIMLALHNYITMAVVEAAEKDWHEFAHSLYLAQICNSVIADCLKAVEVRKDYIISYEGKDEDELRCQQCLERFADDTYTHLNDEVKKTKKQKN